MRTKPRELTGQEILSANGLQSGDIPLIAAPDRIVPKVRGAVAWYQRNETSIWSSVRGRIIKNGGEVSGTGSHIQLESRGPDWGNTKKIPPQVAWHRFMIACCGRGDSP